MKGVNIMSNLGLYQKITTYPKKIGGPLQFLELSLWEDILFLELLRLEERQL